MPRTRSHSFSSQSDQDITTSSSFSTVDTPPTQTQTVSQTSALAAELLRNSLFHRKRSVRKPSDPKKDEMFSSKKYSPLPTSSSPQRKRATQGFPTWKRYGLIATAVFVFIFLGYGFSGGSKNTEVWDAERELSHMLCADDRNIYT